MNLERLIQIVLRLVVARSAGLLMNRAFRWFERRGSGAAARADRPADSAVAGQSSGQTAPPPQGPDAKRLRQQMRLIGRIGRMR